MGDGEGNKCKHLSGLNDRHRHQEHRPFSNKTAAVASMIVICIVQSNCRQLSKYFFSFSFPIFFFLCHPSQTFT